MSRPVGLEGWQKEGSTLQDERCRVEGVAGGGARGVDAAGLECGQWEGTWGERSGDEGESGAGGQGRHMQHS